MEDESKKCGPCESKCEGKCKCKGFGDIGGGICGLGFIGALVFFIQNAESFWAGVVGVLKAIVWPAILVYQLFDFLK